MKYYLKQKAIKILDLEIPKLSELTRIFSFAMLFFAPVLANAITCSLNKDAELYSIENGQVVTTFLKGIEVELIGFEEAKLFIQKDGFRGYISRSAVDCNEENLLAEVFNLQGQVTLLTDNVTRLGELYLDLKEGLDNSKSTSLKEEKSIPTAEFTSHTSQKSTGVNIQFFTSKYSDRAFPALMHLGEISKSVNEFGNTIYAIHVSHSDQLAEIRQRGFQDAFIIDK